MQTDRNIDISDKISKQYLLTLLEGIKDYSIVMLDPEGRVINWTACAELITGYTPAEAIGKYFACFYASEDVALGRPEEALREAAEKGHFEEDGWRVRKDGSRLWVSAVTSALRDEAGQLRGFSRLIREASKRNIADERLREREEQFRMLIEGLKDYAILMLDQGGLVTNWTVSAERIKGYSAGEIIGKSFACFYAPEDIERGHPEEVLRRAAEAGHFEEDVWRVRKDGSRFWANVLITVLRDETGRLRAFSEMTRDITERKRAEETLRESEQQFRAVLESAPDAVVIVDENGNIALINAQTERLFGYRREELVGQPVEILIPAGSRAGHAHHRSEYSNAVRLRQMGTGMTLNGLRKDGVEFPVEVSLSPIQTEKKSWVAAAVRDVTERRIVERELVAERQRAEEANSSKSAFLAAMSHEIRTPMNAILGMSDLLWESDLNSEQREFVEIFRRAGSNLLTLIDNILDLSKIEAGHFELDRQQFNVGDVVDQVIELVGQKARKKGIALHPRIAPCADIDLIGDPGRLRQVLLNLVGNALKFTDAGEITITVNGHDGRKPGELTIAVSDTGIGIPADKLDVIFDDFTQADSSTTRKYGGTGLGLSISRRIVERMSGRLTATSIPGVGSTFELTASFEPVAPDQRRVNDEMEDFHGRFVLVIDDNSTNRLILRETLASWGLRSDTVGTAAEGLAHLARAQHSGRPYSLVILDHYLPDMDGLETAAAIRKIDPAVPLIILSSDPISGNRNRRTEVGATGFAVTPVNRADLLRMIRDAMNQANASESQRSPGASLAVPQSDSSCPLRILIAEDAPDNRLLLQAYLKGGPYILTFAEDGQSAVEEFGEQSFDLILMDILMPVMDGFTATRTIRELERRSGNPATPIIALTALLRTLDVEMSKEAGCDFYLSKPISKQKLVRTIEQYGRRNGSLPPAEEPIHIRIPEELEDLVGPYLSAWRKQVQDMVKMLAASDFERLGILGHNLKGSGTSYGFPDLTRLGAAVEKSARESDAETTGPLLTQIGDYLRRVRLVS